MFKRARVIVSLIVIFTLLLGSAAIVSAGQGPVKTPPPLRINGAGGQIPPGLLAAEPAENAKGYYVVQFVGPVEQAWKDAVTEKGAELLDYLPDFAFKARMNPGQARKVADLPNVAQVSLYHPVYKFAPDVTLGEMALYRVQIERGADWALARKAIIDTGIQVVGIEDAQVTIAATGEQLEAVARVLDVSLIENYRMFVKHNDGAGQIIGSVTANANGYDGSTQTVGIADTGIGGGTAATAHVDIPASRITAIYNWPGATNTCFSSITNDGSIDVDSGHGTHTSGSILSDGGPNGEGKGTAPAAHLVFQSIENYVTISTLCKLMYGYTNGYYLTGLPTDLKTLFQQAYNAGARIHSNSWGSASAGAYTTDSANADAFIWTNKDMVITFSAGNEGIDSNSDGVIDTGSLGAPASAKNVISVGASENARADGFPCDAGLTYTQCAAQGGVNNIMTYGGGWPTDYPANPIKDDPSGGNPEQMAAFSSRGPAADGRMKPDVVAPGTWVLSTYSDLYQQGYDSSANPKNSAWQYDGWGFPYNVYYKYMGGTSMSNPLLAGGAAVIRDYYQKANGINASAALVKATLVNTAVDLLDENNDGANDNDYPIPNNNEGWGRVNLAAATSGSVQYVEGAGLATNGTAYYTVTPTGGPLKITVAWSDYAAAANASVTLVNDLDLTVSGGAGNFLGNVFSGGWSATGGSVDRRNNLENVYIASPGAGDYTVGVKGYNVPNGPQPYALVVTGGTISIAATPTNTPTVPPTATFTPTPTNTPGPVTSTGYKSPAANSAVTKSAGDNNGYQTSPTSAYADDGIYAQDPSSGTGSGTTCGSTKRDKHIYYNYTFSLPTGAVPKGIEVRADAKVSPTTGTPNLCVELSWNGGTSWTTGKTTSVLTNTEVSYILGGSTNLWGRTWTASEFGTTTFRVRVTDLSSLTSNTFYLDYIAVNVTYQ